MSNDEGSSKKAVDPVRPEPATSSQEERRLAARRRFLRRTGSAAGSGIVIYTIHHTRAFAGNGNGGKKLLVSSPTACASVGGSEAKKVKAVDSVNPVQKRDKNGNLVFDNHDNPVYEKTAIRYQCTVK